MPDTPMSRNGEICPFPAEETATPSSPFDRSEEQRKAWIDGFESGVAAQRRVLREWLFSERKASADAQDAARYRWLVGNQSFGKGDNDSEEWLKLKGYSQDAIPREGGGARSRSAGLASSLRTPGSGEAVTLRGRRC